MPIYINIISIDNCIKDTIMIQNNMIINGSFVWLNELYYLIKMRYVYYNFKTIHIIDKIYTLFDTNNNLLININDLTASPIILC
jgi:hypothetical protein